MLLKVPGYAQKLFVWQRVIIKTTITEREFEYKQINLEGLFTLSIARIQQDFVWEYHIRSLTVAARIMVQTLNRDCQGADKNNPALISRHA
ncbi:TPA: hypothetical protein ACK8Z3_000723 [Legionella pneumophila]|uniref:Uncharacterized protein n=2 Tax=Legionella pneumophila TaxID=446 RepID=A0A130TTG9_LEGPN|nr:hypothetical protein [Legionella pneumophila]ADG25514.1 hypothetical protein lpa_03131 [Legionella pneumophila 2300/99 Alcoy]ERB42295.1 hypothetical protein N748_04835 [Legionella pneumophila str. 121004]ERH41247.1 hypothetical protein N750_02970 [Legionella pneumophila str. Leg01/53]ERH45198.1 hypothetical protein N751_00910 [Legionella pneumophila str. Leg01/11]ERI48906.1 hypothetical protein N749_07880 [Legionella pneumophila str. Leg01/20]